MSSGLAPENSAPPATPSTPVSSSVGPSTSSYAHATAPSSASTGGGHLSRTPSAADGPNSTSGAGPANNNNNNVAAQGTGTDGAASKPREDQAKKPLVSVNLEALIHDVKRRGAQKGRSAEEVEAMAQTAARIAERIAADQTAALRPDTESPFRDAKDVVQRLLPYHIFQHPAEDLAQLAHGGSRKGKRKATEEDLLREEIAETKFAIECWKRKNALERRFRRIRTNEGKRKAPDDQAYVLAQAVLEAERAELTSLNNEYRAARAELDKIEREKKAAAAAAAAAAAPPPAPPTPVASRMPYYPPPTQATTTTFVATPANYNGQYNTQYRNYTYPYAQPYGQPYTYTPPATASSSTQGRKPTPMSRTPSNVPVLQLAPPNVSQPAPPPPTTTSAPPSGTVTPVTSTPTAATAAMGPIPVHLPVSSLVSLSALGIVPVPAANAPPADQPQPACVLKGTTQNGTMVSLDINVSALGQAQASGLAVLLSAMTARSGTAGAAPTTAEGGARTTSTSGGGTQGSGG